MRYCPLCNRPIEDCFCPEPEYFDVPTTPEEVRELTGTEYEPDMDMAYDIEAESFIL